MLVERPSVRAAELAPDGGSGREVLGVVGNLEEPEVAAVEVVQAQPVDGAQVGAKRPRALGQERPEGQEFGLACVITA